MLGVNMGCEQNQQHYLINGTRKSQNVDIGTSDCIKNGYFKNWPFHIPKFLPWSAIISLIPIDKKNIYAYPSNPIQTTSSYPSQFALRIEQYICAWNDSSEICMFLSCDHNYITKLITLQIEGIKIIYKFSFQDLSLKKTIM